MPIRRLLLWAVCVATPLWSSAEPAGPIAEGAPRLGVVIVVDQMRADYLARFASYYGEDGFKRLMSGADFAECHYRHSVTKTAPGHASILTGVFAAQHGIVANEWINRETWSRMESVEDEKSALVGAPPTKVRSPGGVLEAKTGRSPRNLLVPTLGDMLKTRFEARSRVVSVAKKDRSAILMGGARADAVFWLDEGHFVTSRYYADALPAWVKKFNATDRVSRAFGQTWDRLLPVAEYDRTQGADDVEGEDPENGLGRTFPRRIDGGEKAPGKAFFEAYDISPLNSELLADFAIEALRAEQLGRHEAVDLFCVSFSQIDSCGHYFGPDSHEVMDSMIRLDRVIARLLAALDENVGAGKWVAVLTADHGVCPIPELTRVRQPGTDAGRFRAASLEPALREAVDREFGPLPKGEAWFARDGLGFHIRPEALRSKKLTAPQVAAVMKPVISAAAGVGEVHLRAEVGAMSLEGDSLASMLRRSFHDPRSPDLVFVLKPYWIDRSVPGTNHGMPHAYDTHVPFLWYGTRVSGGRRNERVGVDDLVPTLAALLGVEPPVGAHGRRLLP